MDPPLLHPIYDLVVARGTATASTPDKGYTAIWRENLNRHRVEEGDLPPAGDLFKFMGLFQHTLHNAKKIRQGGWSSVFPRGLKDICESSKTSGYSLISWVGSSLTLTPFPRSNTGALVELHVQYWMHRGIRCALRRLDNSDL